MDWIDWTRLIALRDDIGEESFEDVALLFVVEIAEHLGRLRSAPGDAVAADFHFLKGSAANMGFTALVAACEDAERACISGRAPDIDAVDAAFRGAIRELKPKMPALAAAA